MPASRRRGLSMGARMLLFSSIFLLALPWLGYRYMDEMKHFLLQGQEEAQLLAAGALATVLHGRSELFHPVGGPVDMARAKSALYVYPLEAPAEVDGYSGDWEALQPQARHFVHDNSIRSDSRNSRQAVSFNLLLGQYDRTLYALVRVTDRQIVYRHPGYRRLDHSDHVRLSIVDSAGASKRFILITDGEGQVSVYEMEPDWKTPVTGQPVYALSGVWRERGDGYNLEFRLPVAWLGSPPQLMVGVVNVDSPHERRIDSVVATLERDRGDTPNLLITRSPELDRILQGLGGADATICVVDTYRRVRGVYGGSGATGLCAQVDAVSGELVEAAFEGRGSVLNYQGAAGEPMIVAVHPVYSDDGVLGAVLVEKNRSHILGLQRQSLLKIIIATFVLFIVAIFGLMLFAAWLAYRIRRLQREVSLAIDAHGRVIEEQIQAERFAADEIGQLSRQISLLLSRLKSYTGFLESVPRTLRHEILNPVNTISMSLQKLDAGESGTSALRSAHKATQQLEMIVHSLTEAAHIDEALAQDAFERFDIATMIREYVDNSKLKHGEERLGYHGPESGLYVKGSDLRIAQLLDKLKDNALDFSADNSRIVFELTDEQDKAVLSVINDGPEIPQDLLDALFHGMISRRPDRNTRPHLGIGLYIANRIARQHNGDLHVYNRHGDSGVRVCMELPLEH